MNSISCCPQRADGFCCLSSGLRFRLLDAPGRADIAKPAKALADLDLAPLTRPTLTWPDKGDMMLILEQAAAPALTNWLNPEFKLAGLRLNPVTDPAGRVITGLRLKN